MNTNHKTAEKTSTRKPNSLIREKSPYLLQHAYNPVDWHPWQEETFIKATSEDKPIFLSIGYSTCHWCHVMERESFEDQEVADLLNRYFVSVKVDREERPDVDHLYMQVCQLLTGSGGWPLTVILTPDKKPFYAGTYFPKHSRYGRPGLTDILSQLGELWQKDSAQLNGVADKIIEGIKDHNAPAGNRTRSADILASGIANGKTKFKEEAERLFDLAYDSLSRAFDARHGGFGRAPKFPSPHNFGFLLRYMKTNPQSKALAMVRKTLDSMARGGIYDHIGFGFARYSTDERWLVPHFEKMLYDNALLAYAYLELYQSVHDEDHARIARDIFDYVLREMTSPIGAFYSAEDADSEGIEGKFYVWALEEMEHILGKETARLFGAAYDITPQGNFEGKNIPNRLKSDWEKLAQTNNLSMDELAQHIEKARQKLWAVREQRIHPHKDDKILTSWNSLMIASLAKGAQVLADKAYLAAAEKTMHFILQNLVCQDGRLLARYRDGEAAYPGYLDDYAFLVWALLELYTASGKPEYLKLALKYQEGQEKLFFDYENGGYFLTGSDSEELLFRPKESYDSATPSGNSISALNLIRLAHLTGEPKWEERAERQLLSFYPAVDSHPASHTAFLQAWQFASEPSQEVVLVGPLDAPSLPQMHETIFTDFHPFATVLHQEGTVGEIVPWVQDYPVNESTTAYLCENLACQKPVHSADELNTLLNQ